MVYNNEDHEDLEKHFTRKMQLTIYTYNYVADNSYGSLPIYLVYAQVC